VQKPGHIDVAEPAKEEITTKQYEVGENNPVVLTLDGRDVTRVEVLDNFAKSGSQLPQGANLAQVFPLMQEQYLIGELIANAADAKGIDSDHPVVQKELNAVLERATRAAYIDEVGKEKVADEDVRKAYEDIIGNAPAQMERKARHILVEKESTANALIVKLNQGRDFAKLAEKESTGPTGPKGGDLGYFVAGEMVPEFSKAAFDLEIGKFTQKPVKTQFGYHIIKVEDERERAKPTFEEVKDQLAGQLRQAATSEAIQALRKDADVIVFNFAGEEIKAPEEEVKADTTPVEDEKETNDVVKEEQKTE